MHGIARTLGLTAACLLTAPARAQADAATPAAGDATANETTKEAPTTASPSLSADQAELRTEKAPAPGGAERSREERKPDPRDALAEGEGDDFGHGLQVGLRGSVVFGYEMNLRYERSPLCQPPDLTKPWNKQKKICGYGAPTAVEVAVSFAPLDGVEPYLFGRFGLAGEPQTNTQALRLFGVGARIYTMSDSPFKIFVEPALGYETEGGAGNRDWNLPGLDPEYKKDLVFHLGVGPQYDFARAVGLFGAASLDVGMLRSLSAVFTGQVGLQIRFP